MQDRRIVRHRLDDVDDVRQNFIIHIDQIERLARRGLAGRGNRRHGMAFIKRLFTGQNVAAHVGIIGLAFADRLAIGRRRQIGAGNHRLDADQGLRLRRVDRNDPRVGMGAAQDLAGQHSRQRKIGAEAGAPGYLVDAIGADRAFTDPFELLCFGTHGQAPLISAAVSITARTILS